MFCDDPLFSAALQVEGVLLRHSSSKFMEEVFFRMILACNCILHSMQVFFFRLLMYSGLGFSLILLDSPAGILFSWFLFEEQRRRRLSDHLRFLFPSLFFTSVSLFSSYLTFLQQQHHHVCSPFQGSWHSMLWSPGLTIVFLSSLLSSGSSIGFSVRTKFVCARSLCYRLLQWPPLNCWRCKRSMTRKIT